MTQIVELTSEETGANPPPAPAPADNLPTGEALVKACKDNRAEVTRRQQEIAKLKKSPETAPEAEAGQTAEADPAETPEAAGDKPKPTDLKIDDKDPAAAAEKVTKA